MSGRGICGVCGWSDDVHEDAPVRGLCNKLALCKRERDDARAQVALTRRLTTGDATLAKLVIAVTGLEQCRRHHTDDCPWDNTDPDSPECNCGTAKQHEWLDTLLAKVQP